MKIALLSWESLHGIAVGGVAAHVTELAAALTRSGGNEVHLFTRSPGGDTPPHAVIDGVHVHRVGYHGNGGDLVSDIHAMCDRSSPAPCTRPRPFPVAALTLSTRTTG
eukprot:TRINITY_DN2646_c0_g1_i2.p8 TRINITY_DN2646_c0_g1~~TRINITY_DN2646_c0_g1_i2.p8  ORF type:complete len:108 (-),score=31.93 TRINITY_DN2646_c0_g1_i2:660-983(-)